MPWGRGLLLCGGALMAALFFGVSSVSADTLDAQLTGVVFAPPYTTVNLTLYTDATQAHIATDSGGHPVTGNAIAGAELWHRTGGTGSVAQGIDFKTYCIEITQDVILNSPPATYDFTLQYNMADAPVPGSDVVTVPTGSGTGMGTTKADLLSRLWAAEYNTSLTNAIDSAAFQLAIWKVVYADPTTPGGTTLDLNLKDGQLVALNPGSGTQGQIVGQAQTWLNGVGSDTQHANLVVLTSTTAQDQITAAAPLPATAQTGMALLAGIGALASVRKRIERRHLRTLATALRP